MSDAVLPRRELLPIVSEPVHDELADSAQRQSFLRRLEDRHGDEGDVRVGRLHGATLLPRRAAFVRLGAVLSRAKVIISRVPVQGLGTPVQRLTFIQLHRVVLLDQVNVDNLVVFVVVGVRWRHLSETRRVLLPVGGEAELGDGNVGSQAERVGLAPSRLGHDDAADIPAHGSLYRRRRRLGFFQR